MYRLPDGEIVITFTNKGKEFEYRLQAKDIVIQTTEHDALVFSRMDGHIGYISQKPTATLTASIFSGDIKMTDITTKIETNH